MRLHRKENKQLQTLSNYKVKEMKKYTSKLIFDSDYTSQDKDYPLKLVLTEQLKAQQEYLCEKHQVLLADCLLITNGSWKTL